MIQTKRLISQNQIRFNNSDGHDGDRHDDDDGGHSDHMDCSRGGGDRVDNVTDRRPLILPKVYSKSFSNSK